MSEWRNSGLGPCVTVLAEAGVLGEFPTDEQTHTELRPVTRQPTVVAAIDTDLYKKQLAHCQLQHYSIANDSNSSSSGGATRSHHLAACQEVGRLLRAATIAAYTHDTDSCLIPSVVITVYQQYTSCSIASTDTMLSTSTTDNTLVDATLHANTINVHTHTHTHMHTTE
eukprot:12612-Heterococcus_DN1.PRE.1